MKKLLSLAIIALMLMPVTETEAGYALFQQRKIELESRLNSLELQREQRKTEDKSIEALDEEIKRTREELQKLNEAENKINLDETPEFNGIG